MLKLSSTSALVLLWAKDKCYKSKNAKRMVFEFLKQIEDIDSERAIIADKVFGLISNQCNCPEIVHYNYSKIERLYNLQVLEKESMRNLELKRTKKNKYFQNEKSGWIDICLLRRKLR